jgi:surface antigen
VNPPYPCLNVPPDGFCRYTPTYEARECVSGASWWASQYQRKPWPTGWGSAVDWPAMARRAGFPMGSRPQVNSVMCVPPWLNGAGGKGHVAWVTGQPINGRVSVIEMNFLIPYGFGYRDAPIGGCEFIYLTAPDPPHPPPAPVHSGEVMQLYQQKNGTIWQFLGNSKLALGTGADAQYLMGLGWKLTYEKDITTELAAAYARLPVI